MKIGRSVWSASDSKVWSCGRDRATGDLVDRSIASCFGALPLAPSCVPLSE